MNMEKTAMGMLIEELKETRKQCIPEFINGIDHAIIRASAYLETEKNTVVDAFDSGEIVGYARQGMTGEEYFNNKFKK